MIIARIGPRSSSAMFRFIAFFFATHIGRLIAGSTLLISGFIYGYASHAVIYQQDVSRSYNVTLDFHDESYYLQPDNAGDKYYSISIADFKPEVPDLTIAEKNKIYVTSFVYSNTQQKLDKQYPDLGISLVGTSYQVVEFTLVDSSGPQQYSTSEYILHPHGFYENHWWGYGAIGIILGLLFFCLSLLVYILDKRAHIRALQGNSVAS